LLARGEYALLGVSADNDYSGTLTSMVLIPHSEYCCCYNLPAASQRSQRKMTISCARK